MRVQLGDINMSQFVPGTMAWCADPASLLSPFQALCLPYDVSHVASQVINSGGTATPPPPPPGITVVSATTPGAVFAGNDSSGNPVYLLPQSAQDNEAANAAALTSFFGQYAADNPATDCSGFIASEFDPVCAGQPPDCSLVMNSLFNSQCGGSLWKLGAAVGLGIVGLILALKR